MEKFEFSPKIERTFESPTDHCQHDACPCMNGVVGSVFRMVHFKLLCLGDTFSTKIQTFCRDLKQGVVVFCDDECARLACTPHQLDVCPCMNGIMGCRLFIFHLKFLCLLGFSTNVHTTSTNVHTETREFRWSIVHCIIKSLKYSRGPTRVPSLK